MPLIHTEAITLRRRRVREADAVILLFTKDRGKITAALNGVAKTSSKFAGVTQPFNHLHLVLYAKNEMQDIWTITQSALIQQYPMLQSDLHCMTAASCLVEWVDALSTDFDSARPIWNLLQQAFSIWDKDAPTFVQVLFFQWHLLLDAGLLPEISQCIQCRSSQSQHWVYHQKEGGILCGRCSHEGLPVSPGALQVIRLLLQSDSPPSVRLSGNQKREIMQLMKQHIEYHADFSSSTHLFFTQLQNQNYSAIST